MDSLDRLKSADLETIRSICTGRAPDMNTSGIITVGGTQWLGSRSIDTIVTVHLCEGFFHTILPYDKRGGMVGPTLFKLIAHRNKKDIKALDRLNTDEIISQQLFAQAIESRGDYVAPIEGCPERYWK